MTRSLFIAAMAVAMFHGLVQEIASPAAAHDQWANGKAIPDWVKASCCGPADAHHLRPDQVHLTRGPSPVCPECTHYDLYWRVDGYGRVIPYWAVQPSQDGDYWLFYHDEGGGVQSSVYCFFAPMGF